MSTLLTDDKNLCKDDPRRKVIVSQDKGSGNRATHRAMNVNGCEVAHYKIDGDVIKDGQSKKCDYLLLNKERHNAYFIELKGKHIGRAMEQLLATRDKLAGELWAYDYFYRIVYRSSTHDLSIKHDSRFIKWRKEMGRISGIAVVIATQRELTEII